MKYLIAAAVSLLACATLRGPIHPLDGESPVPMGIPKGLRACAVKLPENQNPPDGVLPGVLVDVIGKIREPIQTAVVLQSVKVLAVDSAGQNDGPFTISVTVQVTQTQAKVLELLNEDGTEFSVKLQPAKKDAK